MTCWLRPNGLVRRTDCPKAEDFVNAMDILHDSARDTLVLAQERQANAFNQGKRLPDDIQVRDLLLTNSRTMKLVDVVGTRQKLVQDTIGPFEVLSRISPVVFRLRLPDTYPMHPVFNISHLRKYKPSNESCTCRKEEGNRRLLFPVCAGYGPLKILGLIRLAQHS